MERRNQVAVVTGGARGLGRATCTAPGATWRRGVRELCCDPKPRMELSERTPAPEGGRSFYPMIFHCTNQFFCGVAGGSPRRLQRLPADETFCQDLRLIFCDGHQSASHQTCADLETCVRLRRAVRGPSPNTPKCCDDRASTSRSCGFRFRQPHRGSPPGSTNGSTASRSA